MEDGIFWALAGTAAVVGALHSLAPDHWVPFMAVGRAGSGRPRAPPR